MRFLGIHFPKSTFPRPPLPPKQKKNADRTKEAVDDSAEKQTSSELHYQEFGRSCSRWCRQTLSVSGDKAARSSRIWRIGDFHIFSWWRIFHRNETTIAEHFISRFWDIIWHIEGMTSNWGMQTWRSMNWTSKWFGDTCSLFLAVTSDNNSKKRQRPWALRCCVSKEK